ncbi:MAG: hypothetical protein Q9220_001183 [cf. Caloplaca sp. 1 TL-2023]
MLILPLIVVLAATAASLPADLPSFPINTNLLNASRPEPFPTQAILCYDHRYARGPPLYSSCKTVIEHIATGPNPSTQIFFSRRPQLPNQSKVPKRWEAIVGKCNVEIDVPFGMIAGASLVEIQATARAVMMQCVLGSEEKLGGFTTIGSGARLVVSVFGDPPPYIAVGTS